MTNLKSVARRENLPYKLNGSVGAGGYATVLDVTRVEDGAQCAMKVMHTQKRTRKFLMDTIREEVKNIQALQDHHHFIRVLEAYETKTEVGLVLRPLASQRSLAHCLEEYLETGDANFVLIFDRAFGCLASGLAFMHSKNIRHKDIKPDNILIHEGEVLYCDFGRSHDSTLFASSTTEGPARATRMYMAPEVMAEKPRNSSSDVYSLGCVFLELFFALEKGEEVNVDNFSRNMTGLHNRLLDNMPKNSSRSYLVNEIRSMTHIHAWRRSNSADLAWRICPPPSPCCGKCRTMYTKPDGDESTSSESASPEPVSPEGTAAYGPSPWIWSEFYRRYYYITCDSDGKLEYIWDTRPTASLSYPTNLLTD